MPADRVTPKRPMAPQVRSFGTTGQLPSAAMWIAEASRPSSLAAIEDPPSDQQQGRDQQADRGQQELVARRRLRALVGRVVVDQRKPLIEQPAQLDLVLLSHRSSRGICPRARPIEPIRLRRQRGRSCLGAGHGPELGPLSTDRSAVARVECHEQGGDRLADPTWPRADTVRVDSTSLHVQLMDARTALTPGGAVRGANASAWTVAGGARSARRSHRSPLTPKPTPWPP